MIYKTPLFSLLSDAEIKNVKKNTEIRNVMLCDLTISELHELWSCLYLTKHEAFYSQHSEVRALSILLKRYLLKYA